MDLKKFIHKSEFIKIKYHLKLLNCPYCQKIGNLLLHGFLKSKNIPNGLIKKARRIYCSNRGNHNGCGRTYSIYFLPYLPNVHANTGIIWAFLKEYLEDNSLETAYYNISYWAKLSLWTILRLWYRFKANISRLRTILMDNYSPGATPFLYPEKEILFHLSNLLQNKKSNPIEQFIWKFQISLLDKV